MAARNTEASMPSHRTRGLNWHQLEFFRAVARTGHISRAALEEQLLDGTLDLIFSSPPLAREAIDCTILDAQELLLLLAQSHPLARRRSVRLRAVADAPFVCFKPGHAFRLLTEELCQQ